eukprot:3180991-Amphidinium_carterae.1
MQWTSRESPTSTAVSCSAVFLYLQGGARELRRLKKQVREQAAVVLLAPLTDPGFHPGRSINKCRAETVHRHRASPELDIGLTLGCCGVGIDLGPFFFGDTNTSASTKKGTARHWKPFYDHIQGTKNHKLLGVRAAKARHRGNWYNCTIVRVRSAMSQFASVHEGGEGSWMVDLPKITIYCATSLTW